MPRKTEKIPKGALRFVEEGCHAFAVLKKDDETPPKLQMTVYNGKVIKNHWWWDDLAIDISGMKFPTGKFPVLENHDTSRKVGFHKGKPDTSENKIELLPEKSQFVSTEVAEEFIKLSSEGFPYQASLYAKPTEILRLAKDETAEVNGFTMRGPGTVWRKSEFKEASVCVFGWDSQTKSSAFSKEEMEDVEFLEEETKANLEQENTQLKEGGENMNLEELREKHPDIVTQLTDEVTDKVTKDLTIIFGEEKAILKEEIDKLSSDKEDSDNRLATLEKKDVIREERDRKATSDRIWTECLTESDVDEHLWPKVRKMISFTKFVKDDVFDIEAFTAEVKAEVKDWETRVASLSVAGMGVVSRTPEGEGETTPQKEENKKLSNDLLKRAGQEAA